MWPSRSLNLSAHYFFTMGLVEPQSGSDQAKKPKWFNRTNHRRCSDDYLTNARASSQHLFQVSWAVSGCARPSLKGC